VSLFSTLLLRGVHGGCFYVKKRRSSAAGVQYGETAMATYAIWNNKGGTGKTTLAFQVACCYAQLHPDARVLVVDVCPQANLSEVMLGGLSNNGSARLLERHGLTPRCSIGGYFDARLSTPFSPSKIDAASFITKPNQYNQQVPSNIDLVCGDPLLEFQAIAMNTLANADIPGVNAWLGVIDWLRDFLDVVQQDYNMVFIDTNPSFSMYTQISLSAANRVILPVMADDSSRRAIQNAFSLIYGVKLPSEVYAKYTFATKLKGAERGLPQIHLILKNRLTQYMGAASAYAAVLSGIDNDLDALIKSYPDYFTFTERQHGIVDIRDFGTTGIAAFASGSPFFNTKTGTHVISERRVQVTRKSKEDMVNATKGVVEKL
jgi:cellulose biosynthesis protein BcsQ